MRHRRCHRGRNRLHRVAYRRRYDQASRKRVARGCGRARDGWRHRRAPAATAPSAVCPQRCSGRRACGRRAQGARVAAAAPRQPHWLALRWAHRSACPQQPLRPAAARRPCPAAPPLHHSPWTSRRRRWRRAAPDRKLDAGIRSRMCFPHCNPHPAAAADSRCAAVSLACSVGVAVVATQLDRESEIEQAIGREAQALLQQRVEL